LVIAGAVTVFAGVLLGVAYTRLSGTKAPDLITVEGQPFSLQRGRILIFFYDPQCLHCLSAAQAMSKFKWNDVTLIAVPTQSRFAQEFLNDTKLNARISYDMELLKKTFPFRDPPYAVYLEHGRQRAPLSRFEDSEPEESLRKFGAIQ
jgi:hypothetical protein